MTFHKYTVNNWYKVHGYGEQKAEPIIHLRHFQMPILQLCSSTPIRILQNIYPFEHLWHIHLFIQLANVQHWQKWLSKYLLWKWNGKKKKKVRLRAVLKHSIRNVSVNLWTQNKPTPIRGTYIVIAIRRFSVSFLFLSSYFVALVEGSNLHCCNFSLLHATDLFTKSAL